MNYKEIDTESIYGEYTEALLQILDDFDNISFILSNEKSLELVNEMENIGCKFNQEDTFNFKEFEELYNTDILLISKYCSEGKEYYSLETAYGYDHLKTIEEQEVIFVEDGIVSKEELKEYIHCPIVTLSEIEDLDYENNDLDELFEEITKEVIDSVVQNQHREDFCLHCTIKDAIVESYEIGFRDGIYEE